MLGKLIRAELILMDMLQNPDAWQGAKVRAQKPGIDVLWRSHDHGELILERVHPCDLNDATRLPSSTRTATRVLTGSCQIQMGIDQIDGNSDCAFRALLTVTPQSLCRFEITHADDGYTLVPTRGSVYLVKVSEGRYLFTDRERAPHLSRVEKQRLLSQFRLLLEDR